MASLTSSHPCPPHTHALLTPMPSSHPCPPHTHALLTPMPSSHPCPPHTPPLLTPMPSSHPCPPHQPFTSTHLLTHLSTTPMPSVCTVSHTEKGDPQSDVHGP